MNRDVSTLAPLERLLAGLLHYGTWVASTIIAVGFVLTLMHSNSGVSHPEMMVGMRIVTTGIVLFILLPVLRLMLMFGVFLRERRGCPIDHGERPLTVEKLVRRECVALGQLDARSGISTGVERNGDRSAASLLAQTALSLMGHEVFECAAKVVAEASQRRIGALK